MRWAWCVMLVVLCGCAVAYEEKTVVQPRPMLRRFVSLSDIRPGLSRSEVRSLLSDQVIVGYELENVVTGQYRPITVTNPYRVEEAVSGRKTYTVDYYVVGVRADDGVISDDELEPLVFFQDRLTGIGWDHLRSIIKN